MLLRRGSSPAQPPLVATRAGTRLKNKPVVAATAAVNASKRPFMLKRKFDRAAD